MNQFYCKTCNLVFDIYDVMPISVGKNVDIKVCEQCYKVICIYLAIREDNSLI